MIDCVKIRRRQGFRNKQFLNKTTKMDCLYKFFNIVLS